MIGKTIGQYQVIDKIGEGGMGAVYKAEDTTLHRLVALKTLSGHLTEDEEAKERFIREAQAASSINHPNITTVYEFIEEDDTRLICMEYVEGKTIRDMVETGTVSVRKAIDIIMQAAEALEAAHNKGILHRDVKSANIMVNMEGRVKVMDFGLAHLEERSQLTRTGTTMGTLSYSSPEQISGRTVDRRSELFSLGVVFYELLTGQLPFKASNEAEILFAIINNEPPKVSKLRDDVPELVEAVISRMLEKDSELRYQTCADVIHDLQGIRREMETSTVGITGALQQVQAGKRKMLVTRIGIGVAAAAVIAVGALLLLQRSPQLDPFLVVVLPFQNQTGDPEFDRVCALAGDEIAQGLGEIEFISVVPYRTSQEISSALSGADHSLSTTERIDRLCRETGAATVVTGTLYLLPEEELLQIKVDISDQESGRLLGTSREASGPRGAPQGMLETARDRVMAELATQLDPELDGAGSLITPFPTFRAYQLYKEGVKLFGEFRYPEAIDRLLQAAAIDSIGPVPLLRATVAYSNQGRYAEAESLMTMLVPYRDRYTEYEQYNLDWLVSNMTGDQIIQYQTATALAEMSPNFSALYLAGLECLGVNRPGEAVEFLTQISPTSEYAGIWAPYWTVLSGSYHRMAAHRDELATARKGRELFPHSWNIRAAEIRAVAALGRINEIHTLVEDFKVGT
ncbi:protein kinase [Gemmatimonadota bacterium]